MTGNILSVRNLRVSYGDKEIVKGVNFDVRRGEIFVIVGKSGGGKSTILKTVAGILPNNATVNGEIFFDDKDITRLPTDERRKLAGAEIAMIFQNAGASFCPIRTIGEQIFEAVTAHRACTRREFFQRAKVLMSKINLDENVLDEYPFKLSGGMAQRAGILAAMILEPKLILADEPTSALDVVTQAGVVEELMTLRKNFGVSIIMVTHNLNVAKFMADKIFKLKE